MRRDCATVITEMLSKIPLTNANVKLITDLKWNRNDAAYKAPEETIQWQRTQSTLIQNLPNPTEEWHFEVLSIFTTMSIEDLKKETKKQ